MKRCPFCAEEIQDVTVVCGFCELDIADEQPPSCFNDFLKKIQINNQALKILVSLVIGILLMWLIVKLVIVSYFPKSYIGSYRNDHLAELHGMHSINREEKEMPQGEHIVEYKYRLLKSANLEES